MASLLNLLHLLTLFGCANAVSKLTVDTSSGPVSGFIDQNSPHVAQFLGIPYAESPTQDRRWRPAIPKARSHGINATTFAPNCPQFESTIPSIYNTDAPEFDIPPNTTSEDCLYANVWAPYHGHQQRNQNKSLPAIVWIYGGGWTSGGGDVPYQIPTNWIQRSKKHIVVSFNYRLNIFGFPNAAGLSSTEQNLGLLDQRLAVEWVRDNIANFGGDPSRITLWGQSAGAMSVDFYSMAYPQDPIVSRLIMDSGTALLGGGVGAGDARHTNFTTVATHFGCGNMSAEAELACFQKVDQAVIENFLANNTNNGTNLSFTPIADERTIYANATARALSGGIARIPAILGTNNNEGLIAISYNASGPTDQSAVDQITLGFVSCPVGKTNQNRYAAGLSSFRYYYGGNFSNISPRPWEGAYHSAELPLIFGTSEIARGADTAFEERVSRKMQDLWLAFAEDGPEGLEAKDWNAYAPNGTAIYVGKDDKVVQDIPIAALEGPCNGALPKPGAKLPK